MRRGLGLVTWGLGLALSVWCPPSGGYVSAQEHHQPAAEQKLQGVEPIRCWRQASVGAVTIGEQFSVVLTCAVFESQDAQVVPDESRLNVASIQMAPFEILGGSHPPDVRRGSRRFFQYDYQVRIISRDAVGQDVNVPALTISYRIHSRVGAAAKLEGRDLSYLLPALPIKVLSLVPADADDIRDASEASLATVEALRSRSRIFEALAIALGVFAGIMAVLALVPLARRTGPATAADRNAVPNRAILTAAVAALQEEQTRAARDGWTDDSIAAALASMRLIAAAAIDHPISQKPLSADRPVPAGRLRADHGWPRRRTVTISSAVTPDDLARVGSRDGATTLTRTQQLDELRASLAELTAALYRREPKRDAASLDEAVRRAASMAEALARKRMPWMPRWARR